jgi:hypothetical protein
MMRFAPLALCLLALTAWADLYKWTDEDGKVHYSDQPPPSNIKKTETIKPDKQPAPAAAPASNAAKPAAPKSAAELEMEFRKRRLQAAEADAKAQKDAQADEEKKRNCKRAQDQVSSMQNGGRITRYGPNGEQIFLTDQEIAKELGEAKKAADSWCK